MTMPKPVLNHCVRVALTVIVSFVWVRSAPAQQTNVRQGPQQLKAGDQGVGRQIADLSFTDLGNKVHKLSEYRDQWALVIALTGTGCPLCLKYTPTLAAIEKTYRDRGVAFVFVNPNQSEKPQQLREAIVTHGLKGPYVQDGNKELVQALGARTTTEVFVLDSARTLTYRGAVDDQYGFGYALDAAKRNYLTDALDAVLAGGTPPVAATSAPGCALSYDRGSQPALTSVTYHNRVSRIIQAHCIECHREGGIATIALENHAEVEDYAEMIREVVERGIMPPWFAASPQGEQNAGETAVHWLNDRSLSAAEKADLFAWIEAGAPEGDPQDAPLPRKFPDGWLIGEPDAVFQFARPVKVKATGTMPYQNVIVETDFPDDKWIEAIEVRPGNPSVVHHVLVFIQRPGNDGDAADERSGYWGIYVPGNSTLVYPPGYAKFLPKGARLRFQMHYTPNGTATEDRTRIGLVYAKQPPQHEVRVAGIVNARIRIPPGAENHEEVATLRVPTDVQLLAFLPHMHLRGKAARYELISDSGEQTLLDIPRYDFNWQLLYRFADPPTVQQGDTLRFTAWYDNSENNPANPDPSRTVRWGPQTDEEMHLGYVEYIVPGAKPGEPGPGMRRARAAGAIRSALGSGLFDRLDADADGWITREEVRQRLPNNPNAAGRIFDRLDRDGNEKLDAGEFSRLQDLR